MPNWKDVLHEIQDLQASYTNQSKLVVDTVRRSYLKKLHDLTGRNVIAYYSGFLTKPEIAQSDINDEDKNGFMMAVHSLDRTKGLDLILHTQGGSIGATESIVDYLRKMFKHDLRAIVPQIAMSAGTMIACSCRIILMGKHSNLGPIDPHLMGVPAVGFHNKLTTFF
jgi:ClpP class serine protease